MPVIALMLAGFAALTPMPMAWAYVLFFMGFEFWLLRRIRRAGRAPVPVRAPPYLFSEEEAALIARFRLYFAEPAIAAQASSVLAAIGLSALALAPWLLFRQQLLPAALIGVNLLAVAQLTRQLAPLMVLRIAAAKGDRAALGMLELHDPLWTKIRVANAARE